MSDFLKYWDTRIDANERFFNNYPHIANFAFSECQELWDRMSVDYATLLTRHNALVEAVAWVKECELVRHYVIFEALETCALREITSSISSARAEVDRLIAEGDG